MKQDKERAMLIGLGVKQKEPMTEEMLDELAELAQTAGAIVECRAVQNLPRPERSTYLGSGKAEELAALAAELELDLVIFNTGLSPSQLSNLNKIFPCRVIDRNQLILDIFASRARTSEGKLQVELAQLSYMLPRLIGQSEHLSRQGGSAAGGIGTRGPGETKLETDRRILRNRIRALHDEMDQVRKQRVVERRGRQRLKIPTAALIGYTNAGKSTLMNALTEKDFYVADQLFATLDIVTREMYFADGRSALISDTVGFIRDLPTHLIAAFRATLEELAEADVLLHVVDISADHYLEQMQAVRKILDELKNERPILHVFNKADLANAGIIEHARREFEMSVAISAKTGEGLDDLRLLMQQMLYNSSRRYKILLPYQQGALLQRIYNEAFILNRQDVASGVELELESDAVLAERLAPYLINEAVVYVQ